MGEHPALKILRDEAAARDGAPARNGAAASSQTRRPRASDDAQRLAAAATHDHWFLGTWRAKHPFMALALFTSLRELQDRSSRLHVFRKLGDATAISWLQRSSGPPPPRFGRACAVLSGPRSYPRRTSGADTAPPRPL